MGLRRFLDTLRLVRSTRKIIPSISDIAGVALGICLIAMPLLSGGATPLGTMIVRLSALAVFALALFGPRPLLGLAPLGKPLAALLLLAAFGLVQSLPWPRAAARALSPAHVALADDAATALSEEPPSRLALSLYPAASRRVALDCLIFAALALVSYRVGQRRRRRLWLAGAVLAAAGLQVLVGLRPWLSELVPRLRGSYANPDHLCLLLEMAACVACGGVLWALSTRRFRGQASLRSGAVMVAGTALLLSLSAIAFTGSRSGMVAILFGLTVQVVAANRGRRGLAIAATAGAGLAALGFLAWLGLGRSLGRLTATTWFEVVWGPRAQVWLESLELIRQFPLTGTGLGTFEQAFPLVQPVGLDGVRWAKAHNDVLEWTVSGGAVGALVAAAGAFFLIRIASTRLRSAVGAEDRAMLASSLGCLAAVGLHECFDFGLSLPANAFVLVALVAASLAGGDPPRGRLGRREDEPGRRGGAASRGSENRQPVAPPR